MNTGTSLPQRGPSTRCLVCGGDGCGRDTRCPALPPERPVHPSHRDQTPWGRTSRISATRRFAREPILLPPKRRRSDSTTSTSGRSRELEENRRSTGRAAQVLPDWSLSGETPLDDDGASYLARLKQQFALPEYEAIAIHIQPRCCGRQMAVHDRGSLDRMLSNFDTLHCWPPR